jgi:chromosomal replication initiation ATPase DnaA
MASRWRCFRVMPDAPRQLALDLPVAPSYAAEDFLVSPSNERAYALIEAWPAWPDCILHLQGPKGSGKTHLAGIWAGLAHAWAVEAFEVSAAAVPQLLAANALVIENADAGDIDEAAFFHLLNRARERRASILLTSQTPVDAWGLRTPDLLSRLRLAPVASLEPPDDALLRAVLVKLFLDRQLVVDTSVVDYMAVRLERSLNRAAEAVAALDREALSRGSRLTRAMAARLLAEAPREEDGP